MQTKFIGPYLSNAEGFRAVIDLAPMRKHYRLCTSTTDKWSRAPYHPTPTIVEAARALYAQHSVEAIARFKAPGAQNLHVTSRRIEDLVDEAERKRRKLICFVTGVPGAGKTLVGLNVATRRREVNNNQHTPSSLPVTDP